MASIAAYGDTLHTFVERRHYAGAFLPGFKAVPEFDVVARPVGLRYVDDFVRGLLIDSLANVQITELPLNNRNFEQLILLQPGVATVIETTKSPVAGS